MFFINNSQIITKKYYLCGAKPEQEYKQFQSLKDTTMKRIPYAITNFESIRTENYLYVDKTRFIEQLENEPTKYNFLIRPRKFGKSLFTSVLDYYYDIRHKDKFDTLFGELYIGKHPTPKANTYLVMNFDFSGLDTSGIERFKISFTAAIRSSITTFLTAHRRIIKNHETLREQLWNLKEDVRVYIEFAFNIIENYERKAYIIIDEYDHFANDVIAKGTKLSKKQYEETVWANSVTKDFYETLKTGTKTVIDKMFVTGITPIMLDDLTSGFNISNNLSTDANYNEILGLTSAEIDWVIQQTNLDKSKFPIDLEKMYNGYVFHEKAPNKIFNSTMVFNYLLGFSKAGIDFKYIVDDNLKIDYGRLRTLINAHNNKEKLRNLIETNSIDVELIKQFSIEKIHEEKNFFSLLYYMGLLTIDNSKPINIGLKIPNYSVKTIFWNFLENMLTEEFEGLSLDDSKYRKPIYQLAYENTYEPFFDYFSKNILHYLSNRDLQKTVEKDIKFLLLPLFFTSNYYLPFSELENSEGYTDIYLQRGHLHPESKSDWIFEIKYIPQAEAKKTSKINAAKTDAKEQLQRYKTSNTFRDKTDLRYLSIVFIGKKDYSIEEI
jgi:hypothetical protein